MKRSKTQKNKPWTDKETNIFAAVLSSTESRVKPFALVLETMALGKTANESVFNHVREEFEDMLVAEGITAYFGNTRNSQARSSRSVGCLLSHVIVDAIADSFSRILLVSNVVLNS